MGVADAFLNVERQENKSRVLKKGSMILKNFMNH